MTMQATTQPTTSPAIHPELQASDESDVLITKVLAELGNVAIQLLGNEYKALQDVISEAPKSLRQIPAKLQVVDKMIAIVKKGAEETKLDSNPEEKQVHMIRLVKQMDSLFHRTAESSPFGKVTICNNLV